MRKTILLASVLTLILVSLLVASCATPSQAPAPSSAAAKSQTPAATPVAKAKTTLTVVSFQPRDTLVMQPVKWLTDRVNQQGQGELAIDYKGGPEVILPLTS